MTLLPFFCFVLIQIYFLCFSLRKQTPVFCCLEYEGQLNTMNNKSVIFQCCNFKRIDTDIVETSQVSVGGFWAVWIQTKLHCIEINILAINRALCNMYLFYPLWPILSCRDSLILSSSYKVLRVLLTWDRTYSKYV